MRTFFDPLVLTSWLFVVPAFLWALSGCVIESLIVMLAAASAVVYHRRQEPAGVVLAVDQMLAVGALVLTLERYYVTAMRLDGWAVAVVIIGIIAVQIYGLNRAAYARADLEAYESIHVAWHVVVLVGQCVLALAVWCA
jgi:hypothetical protein